MHPLRIQAVQQCVGTVWRYVSGVHGICIIWILIRRQSEWTCCFMESVERGMSCSVCMTFTVGFLGHKTHGKVNGNIRKSKSEAKCMCLK